MIGPILPGESAALIRAIRQPSPFTLSLPCFHYNRPSRMIESKNEPNT